MSDTRRQWPPSASILRHGAEFDFYCRDGAAYDCGFGGGCADSFGDGEDSGYTEIPMVKSTTAETGLRDRIARLVFRPPKQQPVQTPPPPPPPSSQSRHPQTATGVGFPDYAYTRWERLPTASSTPPPPRSARPAPAVANGAGGGNQRTVRFRCPCEPAAAQKQRLVAAEENRWAIQPYSTFALAGSLPALGERSTSSGYGSDVDIGGGGAVSDFYAVREEDIDRLLQSAASSSAASSAAAVTAEVDLDVQTLDLAAYFPPPGVDDFDSQKMDRLVGNVVRLKTASSCRGSPRRQHQRGDFTIAASAIKGEPVSLELTDLHPASALRSGEASYRCYYQ